MPRGNGTGPEGMGPMTGRAAGSCAGFTVPGYANNVGGQGLVGRGPGFGAGRGFGRGGRGRRNQFFATGLMGQQRSAAGFGAFGNVGPYGDTKEQQLESLKAQAGQFEGALEAIKTRIAELEAKSQ